jgi:hypothetical protein
MSKTSCVVAGVCAAALLAGCTDTKRALGIEKAPPDEFAVVSRAPLELPPEFSLRPPQPGMPRPQDSAPQQQARQTIFRAGEQAPIDPRTANRSVGEQALLRQAGAGETDSRIRQIVNAETTKQIEADRSFVDTLLFWKTPQAPGTVVDPSKETQRLRENLALGKAPTEGETPIIQRKKRGLIDSLF